MVCVSLAHTCSQIICTQIFNYATNCQQTKHSGNARSRYFNFWVILKRKKGRCCAIYDVFFVLFYHVVGCVDRVALFSQPVGVSFKAFLAFETFTEIAVISAPADSHFMDIYDLLYIGISASVCVCVCVGGVTMTSLLRNKLAFVSDRAII